LNGYKNGGLTRVGENMNIVSLVLFVGVFYFILWFVQNKRTRKQLEVMNSLQQGDEVMTTAGILGKIAKIQDDLISLTIAPNVDITIQKEAVVRPIPKGTLK
jgi:preprotein translocase subunit YajC